MSVGAQNRQNWPEVLPGFGHVTRFWDAKQDLCSPKILPGEYYVTCHNEIITTVLGSCVSACIRDPNTGVGGMNHFMLPGDKTKNLDKWGGEDSLETRYGIAAMESLVNEVLKLGASKQTLELKLFGGGAVLAMMEMNDVGQRNVDFVKKFVRDEGLNVLAEDLGGAHPRSIRFFPHTGKVMVKHLRGLHNRAIANLEHEYETNLGRDQAAGEIDLF